MASSNGADIVNNDASLSIGLTVHYSEPSSRKPQEASTTVNDPESGGAPENDTTSPRQEESPPPQPLHKLSTPPIPTPPTIMMRQQTNYLHF